MERCQTIVIGGNHHNTLGVIRSLGLADTTDIKLILVGKDDDFVSRSKYVKKKNIIKIESDESLPATLLKIGKESSTKPVVICSSDTSISIIDQNFDELSKYLVLPNAKNNLQMWKHSSDGRLFHASSSPQKASTVPKATSKYATHPTSLTSRCRNLRTRNSNYSNS